MVPDDLDGFPEDVARRVIVYARSIAPCLDSLTGESKSDAIAILNAIASEIAARGSRQIAQQAIGSASIRYNVGSFFSDDDRAGLRSLCTAAAGASGPRDPVGSFPLPSRTVHDLFPEPPYAS